MARVSNTLIGPSSGSVGNAVFSTWKGINVLKEKPISVANPNTDGQKMQRSAMRQVVSIFRQAPSAIRAGFKKLAVQKSEWNAFASNALRFAFDFSAPPTATLVPADILVSKGTISTTPITNVVASVGAGTISVTFPTTTPEPGMSATDNALIVAYNSTQDDWTGSLTADARSTGSADIPMPATWDAADVLHTYLGFSSPLSGESSDSIYNLGAIVA